MNIIKKMFWPYTVMKPKGKPQRDQRCWWDLTRSDCAKCNAKGQQCGFPMHKWCQSKNAKKGCPGITKSKFTLSSRGYPCYWDNTNNNCAWCTSGTIQCRESQATLDCGGYCGSVKDLKCDGVATNCVNIPKCGLEASCDKKRRRCTCDKGFKGNGFQCIDKATGEIASNPKDQLEISLDSRTKFWVYPGDSDQFPV